MNLLNQSNCTILIIRCITLNRIFLTFETWKSNFIPKKFLYALSKLSWALAKSKAINFFQNGNSFLYLAGVGKVIFRRIILTSSYAFFGHQAL